MNIFVLDYDPYLAARYHCDEHVVKMVLESAQMICAVLSKQSCATPYKPTHLNHPCTLWAGASQENFDWLTRLAEGLNTQFRARYKHTKNHKSWDVIYDLLADAEYSLPPLGLTPFTQAMPEELRQLDAVSAYRAYYKTKQFASWSRGVSSPNWW